MYILNKADTKFKITNVIRKILMQNQTLQLLVGKRIFPIMSIEAAGDGDCILYERESYSMMRTKQGIYEQEVYIFITCISSDYDTSQEIAEQVFLSLQDIHNYIDEESGMIINWIDMADSTESYAADKFIQVLKFRIM